MENPDDCVGIHPTFRDETSLDGLCGVAPSPTCIAVLPDGMSRLALPSFSGRPGETGSIVVTVSRGGGYTGAVSLAVTGGRVA